MRDIINYFDTATVDSTSIYDVWKQIDLSTELASNNYTYHELNAKDNLMGISYRYYENTDDWWILYYFNELYDINFDLLTDEVLKATVDKYIENVKDFSNLIKKDKLETIELVRNYFLQSNNMFTAIGLTNITLNSTTLRNDETFLLSLKDYLSITIIQNSFINKQIKIPALDVILDIKNKLEKYNTEWSNNGN